LDSEKSKVYFFLSWFVQEKNPGHIRSQNFGQKIRKITIFNANPWLVKIVIVQKLYCTFIQYLDFYLKENVQNMAFIGFSESKKASQNARCIFYESNCMCKK
jgi:hypothetical protein